MTDVLGSAAWSKDPGNWFCKPIGDQGAPMLGRFLLLGESLKFWGHLHVQQPLQHVISIAPTRSGKGVSLIIPNLLAYRGAVLAIDPKGENTWITAPFRRRLGQKTVILDPWGEVNRRYGSMAGQSEEVARFNPLSILNPESDEYVDDLAYLADSIIVSQSSREPHFDDSARELLAGLMAFVVESPQYRERASLGLVRELLSLPGPELRVAIQEAKSLGPGSIARKKLSRFDADTNEISSVMSTARTQTAFLDSEVLSRNMDVSDFSFGELCGGMVSIYLVLPPDKLETYARWLRLMVSIAIRAVARGGARGPLKLPALFMLDEFGTIGRLNAVAQASGLMAGLGMIMWVFVQDLNQLRRDYPEHWETFIANAQAVTCFGVMDNFTAEYISKMLGTSTVEHVNITTTQGKSIAPATQAAGWLSDRTSIQTSTSTSTQVMSRPLANPDEIRRLSPELCIIMGRFPPILSRRIVYHQSWDLMILCARPDPYFPRTEEVLWAALRRRLFDVGAVSTLLNFEGYQVKAAKRRGRWEVTGPTGPNTSVRTFADDKELWRWTYFLMMDAAETVQARLTAQ